MLTVSNRDRGELLLNGVVHLHPVVDAEPASHTVLVSLLVGERFLSNLPFASGTWWTALGEEPEKCPDSRTTQAGVRTDVLDPLVVDGPVDPNWEEAISNPHVRPVHDCWISLELPDAGKNIHGYGILLQH